MNAAVKRQKQHLQNQSINHLFAQDKIKMARTHACIKRAGQQGHFGTNSCP